MELLGHVIILHSGFGGTIRVMYVPNTQHYSTFPSTMYMSEYLQISRTVTFENVIPSPLKAKGRRHNYVYSNCCFTYLGVFPR